MKFLKLLMGLAIPILLSGCNALAVGPELENSPSPFGKFKTVVLSGQSLSYPFKVTITHSEQKDHALIARGDLATVPYDADITYQRFTPIIAETNAQRYEYWLIGFNVYKTQNRSNYMIMRYPYDLNSLDTGIVEVVPVTCNWVYMTPIKTAELKPPYNPDDDEKPSTCTLENSDQAYKLGDEVMRALQRERQRLYDPEEAVHMSLEPLETSDFWSKINVKILP